MAANPFISNGTCYYYDGLVSDESFIPCGNDALGHRTCCQAGDMCLSSRACFNQKYGLTYLAGCSDPNYEDASCPGKPELEDSPWVGLVTCKDSNIWSPCSQKLMPTTLTSPDACSCARTSPVAAFTDAPVLTNMGRLPTALGGSIVWQAGYLPTSSTSSTSTSTSSTSSSPTPSSSSDASSSIPPPVTASPTLPSSASTAQPQINAATTMSTGAKAGLGVGITLAVLMILGGIAAFLFFRRRRKRRSTLPTRAFEPETTHDQPMEPKDAWSPSTMATSHVSELDSRAARPWSELEGHTVPSPQSIGGVFEDPGKTDLNGGYVPYVPGHRPAHSHGQLSTHSFDYHPAHSPGHRPAQSQPQGLGLFAAELQG